MKKRLIFLLSIFPFIFLACDTGNETAEFTPELQASYEGEESAEAMYNAVESVTGAVILMSDANSGGRVAVPVNPMLDCAEITFEGDVNSGRIEADFGDGCEMPNGKVVKGSVVVEYEGLWIASGSKIYVVLKDFFVDGIQVEGTIIYTNTGMDMNAWVFTVELTNGKITWPDGTYLTRESDRTYTLSANGEEFELQIEGTASGTTRKGYTYSSEITEPLVLKTSCLKEQYFVPSSGMKTIEVKDLGTMTVNYGDGECDNKITVSIGPLSKEIDLSI